LICEYVPYVGTDAKVEMQRHLFDI